MEEEEEKENSSMKKLPTYVNNTAEAPSNFINNNGAQTSIMVEGEDDTEA